MSERIRISAKAPETKRENKAPQIQKSERSQSMDSPVDRILFLQRTIGNQAVWRLIKPWVLQAKLRIAQPADIYGKEADRVAEQVMRIPEPRVSKETKISSQLTSIQRMYPGCTKGTQPKKEENEEVLQMKKTPGSTSEATPELESSIGAIRGGGQPLPKSVRAFFEPRFGQDFSQVRVHMDAEAAESARILNAQAYTIGQDIVFGTGRYTVETTNGRRLLAHELTHVAQQPETTTRVIRREEEPTRKQIARDTHLRRLAVWPGEALYAWRRLIQVNRWS